jgi:hypothetical protein
MFAHACKMIWKGIIFRNTEVSCVAINSKLHEVRTLEKIERLFACNYQIGAAISHMSVRHSRSAWVADAGPADRATFRMFERQCGNYT